MQQDWEPVIIHSKAAAKAVTKPQIQGKPKQLVDLESDTPKIRYVDHELSQQIVAARLAKKLNRKQLAQGMMIQESIVADYETGKAIYNGQMINRFKNFLGINITKK
jgi:ribosome-binding protein aMBF1 (putative translation factor)